MRGDSSLELVGVLRAIKANDRATRQACVAERVGVLRAIDAGRGGDWERCLTGHERALEEARHTAGDARGRAGWPYWARAAPSC